MHAASATEAGMAAKKSANKTKPEKASAAKFIDAIADEDTRKDCQKLVKIMKRVTGEPPVMWGTSMVGFGSYHYKYASGREGDSFLTGFSPRKSALTLYVMPGFDSYAKQLSKLGKHKLGKSCLYLDGLDGKDLDVLEEMLTDAVKRMKSK
jgi:hypothetical protein